MVDPTLERAAGFVRRAGTPFEQARLEYLLSGRSLGASVVALLAGQRSNGGFLPPWSPNYSSIDATCFRLAQAEQAGLHPGHPLLEEAVAFLVGRQSGDGSWQEDAEQANFAPRWAMPGNPMAQAYLTANAGLWVARAGVGSAGRKAAEFLKRTLTQDGSVPSFLHANWLAAALFWAMDDRVAAEKLMSCLYARISDISASGLAWLIVSLFAGGVDPGHALIRKARSALLQSQRDDGAFASEDGPTHDVYSTLEAIHALVGEPQ